MISDRRGASRQFPQRPVLCVGGIIVKDDSVVLVRRGQPPQKGRWTIPGGRVELGERAADAVRREILEETGLAVEPVQLAGIYERIERRNGSVRFHYTVLDYTCLAKGGRLRAGSDAAEARWVAVDDLARYGVSREAMQLIEQSIRLVGGL